MTPQLDELISLCRHPKIQERRGEWKEGDMYHDTKNSDTGWVEAEMAQYFNTGEFPNAIWIPPLSDPLCPERSLLGMLKGICTLERNMVATEDSNPYVWRVISLAGRGRFCPTPEIAVCRAIIAQSEEEK